MGEERGKGSLLLYAACILLGMGLAGLPMGILKAIGWGLSLTAPFWLGLGLAFFLWLPLRCVEPNLPTSMGRFRRPAALTVTLLGLTGLLCLIALLVLPQLAASLASLAQSLPVLWQNITTWAERHGEHLTLLRQLNLQSMEWLQGEHLWSGTLQFATGMAGTVGNFAIALVMACYLLLRKETLQRQAAMLTAAWLPRGLNRKITRLLALVVDSFAAFFTVQCGEALILGAMMATALLICRLPYAVLISVIVACTAVVPVFGSFFGCLVGAVLVCAQEPGKVFWFVLVFLCVQQLEGSLVYPHVVGRRVGLPPLWVLTAVTVGGRLLGIAGMLLMIPVFSVVYSLVASATKERLK